MSVGICKDARIWYMQGCNKSVNNDRCSVTRPAKNVHLHIFRALLVAQLDLMMPPCFNDGLLLSLMPKQCGVMS